MALPRTFLPLFAVMALTASRAHAEGAALHLVVRGGLPAEAMRAALAQDTHREVVLDDDATTSPERVTIALRAEGEIAVTFDAPNASTTRVIHVSADAMISDAALLAASLTVGIDVAAPPPPPPPPLVEEPPPPVAVSAPPPIVAVAGSAEGGTARRQEAEDR